MTNPNTNNDVEVRKLLLDFYSSELQTHSSLIIGLTVVLFTILQFLPKIYNGVQIGIGLSIIWIISGSLWYFLMRHFSYGILCKSAIETPLDGETNPLQVAIKVREYAYNSKVLGFSSKYFIAGNSKVTYRGWILCYFVFGIVTTLLLSYLIGVRF